MPEIVFPLVLQNPSSPNSLVILSVVLGVVVLLLRFCVVVYCEMKAWVRFTALMHLKVLDERIRHRQEQAALSSRYPGIESLG